MNDVIINSLGGVSGIQTFLQKNANSPEVQEFLKKAKEAYDSDPEFKSEVEKAGVNLPQEQAGGVRTNISIPEGLSDQEKARILNGLRNASTSGAEGSPQLSRVENQKSSYLPILIGIGAATLLAAIIFRGVVFRTIYYLIVKLPWIGPIIKQKFGEPREIISGKLTFEGRKRIVEAISELEALTGIRGKGKNGYKLVRFVQLMRSLNPKDIEEAYNAAEDFRLLK